MMDTSVIKHKVMDRSDEWNEAGYDGTGVVVWNMEGESTHGKMSRRRVFEAAPGAQVINKSHGMTFEGKELISEGVEYGGESIGAEEFISSQRVKILTCSKGGGASAEALYKRLRDRYNLIMFNSAGNKGAESGDIDRCGHLPASLSMWVGAWTERDGSIEMAPYSSVTDVDFSAPVPQGWNGTSFAAPYLAGLAACLISRYGSMSHEEVYQYLKMCSVPIPTEYGRKSGKDRQSGYGRIVLPELEKKYIVLSIGDKRYKVDAEQKAMDVAPFIRGSRTFVPVAFVAKELGAAIKWDEKHKTVTINKDDKSLTLCIDRNEYTAGGRRKYTDVAPFIRDRRTFVPVSFIALEFGCKVAWLAAERRVLILEA